MQGLSLTDTYPFCLPIIGFSLFLQYCNDICYSLYEAYYGNIFTRWLQLSTKASLASAFKTKSRLSKCRHKCTFSLQSACLSQFNFSEGGDSYFITLENLSQTKLFSLALLLPVQTILLLPIKLEPSLPPFQLGLTRQWETK